MLDFVIFVDYAFPLFQILSTLPLVVVESKDNFKTGTLPSRQRWDPDHDRGVSRRKRKVPG